MDEWSRATYGDPCGECDYSWSLSVEDTIDLIDALAHQYRDAVGDASGDERHPDLRWPVTAYVCHVADNLRIWAERLQGAMSGKSGEVVPYDENQLAEARRYDAIDLQAALWSLSRAATDWCSTVLEALGSEEAGQRVTLVHPERGEQKLVEVARANCHDAVHHRWDIGRTLAG